MGRIICDDSARQHQLEPGTHCNICLSTGQAIGLAFSAQTGTISFLSVIVLFVIIWVKYRRNRMRNPTTHRRILFRTHLDVFMLNLFISELMMSLGGMLDAKWANETQVYCGGFCNAQGSLQYLGETSVALWTLAVTLHTWYSVVYARPTLFRPWICSAIVGAVWVFVLAFNFGAYTSHPNGENNVDSYFAPTPFWCWINSKYSVERLAGEYIWLWITGFGNLLVYIPLFLLLRGNIVLGTEGFKSHRWYWTPPSVQNAPSAEVQSVSSASSSGVTYNEEDIRNDAAKMLWYPIAYTVLVLPLSVVRWTTFTIPRLNAVHHPENSAIATATLVFHAIFRLSGVVNVGLMLATRPNVLLFGDNNRGDDEDELVGHGAARGGFEARAGGADRGAPLRQRHHAMNPNEPKRGNTGFGGPAVGLDRHNDEKMSARP